MLVKNTAKYPSFNSLSSAKLKRILKRLMFIPDQKILVKEASIQIGKRKSFVAKIQTIGRKVAKENLY
jgi:hypothetical protein